MRLLPAFAFAKQSQLRFLLFFYNKVKLAFLELERLESLKW